MKAALALTVGVGILAACADQPPAGPSNSGAPTMRATSTQPTGRTLVQLRGPEGVGFSQAVASLGGKVDRRMSPIGLVSVSGLDASGAAQLARRSDVASVAADVRLQWIPSTERRGQPFTADGGPGAKGTDQSGARFFSDQWNLRRIKANTAWLSTPGGAGATVCVLDTGVDPGHQELVGKVNLEKSASMVESEPFIEDLNFHGTFVSGIISSNGVATASVAPDAELCAIKVLDATGNGSFGDVIAGIEYAAEVGGVDVINMSLGAYFDRNEPGGRDLVFFLTEAVRFARSKGLLVVASAGNDGVNLNRDPARFIHVPSMINGVISVGATAPFQQERFDQLASYSNFGSPPGMDLVAPGGDLLEGGFVEDLIISPCSRYVCGVARNGAHFYVPSSGTSFASPHVAGGGAVIESVFPGNQGAEALERCVLRGTDAKSPSSVYARGRQNVLKEAAC